MDKAVETHPIGDELTCGMLVYDDENGGLEALISIDGYFWVDGGKRLEFKDKVEALINEYKI